MGAVPLSPVSASVKTNIKNEKNFLDVTAVQTLKGLGQAGGRVSGQFMGGPPRSATLPRATRALRREGSFEGWARRKKGREQVWPPLVQREGILDCGEPGQDREMEKGYGARGCCMASLSSRPIRRHLAAIFLRASSSRVTTKPMSSNGAKSP